MLNHFKADHHGKAILGRGEIDIGRSLGQAEVREGSDRLVSPSDDGLTPVTSRPSAARSDATLPFPHL